MSGSDSSGARPTPASMLSDADMRTVLSAILDNIDCPVCYQELQPPIFQCNNGHPVCARCRCRLRSCPVCKSWMYSVRALPLERIIRELPKPCRNAAHGCQVRLCGAARARHERGCVLRPSPCAQVLVPCSWSGPLTQMRAHLFDQHHLEMRLHSGTQGRFRFSVAGHNQEKFLLDMAGGVLFRCIIRRDRGRLNFMCHAIASYDQAAQYIYRVVVTSSCTNRQMIYEGQVVSALQPIGKTLACGSGLFISREWIRGACSCEEQRLQCFDATWEVRRSLGDRCPLRSTAQPALMSLQSMDEQYTRPHSGRQSGHIGNDDRNPSLSSPEAAQVEVHAADQERVAEAELTSSAPSHTSPIQVALPFSQSQPCLEIIISAIDRLSTTIGEEQLTASLVQSELPEQQTPASEPEAIATTVQAGDQADEQTTISPISPLTDNIAGDRSTSSAEAEASPTFLAPSSDAGECTTATAEILPSS